MDKDRALILTKPFTSKYNVSVIDKWLLIDKGKKLGFSVNLENYDSESAFLFHVKDMTTHLEDALNKTNAADLEEMRKVLNK